MATRERPGDLGSDDARRLYQQGAREVREVRRALGMSIAEAARRAGVSASQFWRIERGLLTRPTFDQVFRSARAVGLDPSLRLYPSAAPVRDTGQLPVLGRLERFLGVPLRMRREVVLPITGDQRAWDARIDGDPDGRPASIEAEARAGDLQALSRRIALKQRDDPGAGVVILVLNRTAHNRRVLTEHREALRAQFPLDGLVIARHLRAGKVPPSSGIILV